MVVHCWCLYLILYWMVEFSTGTSDSTLHTSSMVETVVNTGSTSSTLLMIVMLMLMIVINMKMIVMIMMKIVIKMKMIMMMTVLRLTYKEHLTE